MLSTVAGDFRKDARYPRPDCGILGWASAWSVLERVQDSAQRTALANMTRRGGVQGAPAMRYLASILRWHAGLGDYPSSSGALRPAETELIQRRAADLLRQEGTELFPLVRGLR
jgi:hypothetical protein